MTEAERCFAAFAALERELRQLRPRARESAAPSASTPSPAKAPPRASQAQREAFPPASPAVAATATGPGPATPAAQTSAPTRGRASGGGMPSPAAYAALLASLAPAPCDPQIAADIAEIDRAIRGSVSRRPVRDDGPEDLAPDVCRAAADCVEKPVRDGMCHTHLHRASLLSREEAIARNRARAQADDGRRRPRRRERPVGAASPLIARKKSRAATGE